MKQILRGIFPILATTFKEDGGLDLESQARLIDYLLASGAHGLGVFGNASEGYTLLPDERTTLLKLIVQRVNGRVPIVVSTGHTGTDAAVQLSREAEESGASAFMIAPPYYLKPDANGVRQYFEGIGKATKLPIMVQDAPLMTQVAMPATLLAQMAREISSVRYAKIEAPPTAPKVSAVLAASEQGLVVFGGLNGQFLIEEYDRGAVGSMPGSDMTALYVRVWEGLESGDREGVWETFCRMLPLIRFELQPGMGVSAMKHNLQSLGIIRTARVRQPTVSIGADSVQELVTLRRLIQCDSMTVSR